MAYALAGQFDCTLSNFFGPASSDEDATLFDDNNAVMSEAGVCALGLQGDEEISSEHVHSARQLVVRALMVCLAAIALMTLSGWFA